MWPDFFIFHKSVTSDKVVFSSGAVSVFGFHFICYEFHGNFNCLPNPIVAPDVVNFGLFFSKEKVDCTL